nr:type II toxin-antitoxin system VapC family toxin [Candidatus Freyrarchaeum guaymaensis]
MRYLFDTKALIAFFNNEEGAEFVEKLLGEVDEDKAEGFISSITLTEIYYLYSRRVGGEVARKRVEQIRLSNLKVVPIDEKVALKAGEYKVKAIPIADALIAASAYSVGAKIVTDDKHFEGLDVEVVKFRTGLLPS